MARRLLGAVPLLLGVATATFALLRLLPGDPVAAMLAQSGSSPEVLASVRAQLGLDDPWPAQYGRFVLGLARGDLGRSIVSQQGVTGLILAQVPATVALASAALTVAVVLGLGLGLVGANWYGRWPDRLALLVSVLGVSLPSFWLGLLALTVVSFRLRWVPATGTEGIERLVLPALVLGVGTAGSLARLVRASLLEVLSQEFLVTARAKGLAPRQVLLRHALRNALVPVLALLGTQAGWLLGGTIVTEVVFSRQGLGRLVVAAVEAKDFPVVQGVVLLLAAIYVVVNLLADIAYAVVDPRLRGG